MDIEKAVAKELGGNAKRNKNRRKKIAQVGGAPIAQAAGLKISFKPSELRQTTDKVVFLQVFNYFLKLINYLKTF